MRRLGSRLRSHWGGGLVAALGVATAMACAQGADETGYGLGATPDAGDDGSVPLGDGAASSSGTSGKPADGGGSSSGTSGTSGGTCDGKVVINELQTGGSSVNDEFIELYNPNDCEVSLANWSIKYKADSGNTGAAGVAFANGAKIAAKSFLVAKPSGGDVTLAAGLNAGGGSIGLLDGSEKVVDAVGWGTASQGYLEGGAAAAPPASQSLARKQDGVDSNNNKNDFAVDASPTPGQAN